MRDCGSAGGELVISDIVPFLIYSEPKCDRVSHN
uniref:Uncharacterized protein n=1 Tax=Anguilla anguilla TaxID=7936 RepID=A0A0E9WPV8_ANGAN